MQVFGLGTVEARIVSQIGFEASGALVKLKSADLLRNVPLVWRHQHEAWSFSRNFAPQYFGP